MQNLKMQEYDYLRSEVLQKIELNNTLLTFTITTSVAILTLALSLNRTILYLLPFCVIIPMSTRTAYYRSAAIKLSAYMVVFLESSINDLNWETRNTALIKKQTGKPKRVSSILTSLRYYEFLILSIICYIFYVLDYIKGKSITITVVAFALFPLLFVLWEVAITIRINSNNKQRQDWITTWTELKKESSKT